MRTIDRIAGRIVGGRHRKTVEVASAIDLETGQQYTAMGGWVILPKNYESASAQVATRYTKDGFQCLVQIGEYYYPVFPQPTHSDSWGEWWHRRKEAKQAVEL